MNSLCLGQAELAGELKRLDHVARPQSSAILFASPSPDVGLLVTSGLHHCGTVVGVPADDSSAGAPATLKSWRSFWSFWLNKFGVFWRSLYLLKYVHGPQRSYHSGTLRFLYISESTWSLWARLWSSYNHQTRLPYGPQ